MSAQNDFRLTPLRTATEYGPRLDALRTLTGCGADIDARDNCGWTSLMHAACCEIRNPEVICTEGGKPVAARNVAMIGLFIRHGTDVRARSHTV